MTNDLPAPRPPTGPGSPAEPAPPDTDAPVLDQVFDVDSLYALRAAVAAHGTQAGLSPGRADDLVIAVHELAANAVRHGAGHGRLRLLAADGILTCQVTDDGPAAGGKDETADDGTPWPTEHGHGLWVIGQVTSQLTIDRGPAGTTATAVFTLRAAQ
jgi:anti-sigma regulatory factor (Ser/Thr protein kinase)